MSSPEVGTAQLNGPQHPESRPALSSDTEIFILPQIDRYVDEHVAPPFRQHMKEYLSVIFSSHFYRDRIIELISKLNIASDESNTNDNIRPEAWSYQISVTNLISQITGASIYDFPSFMDSLENLYEPNHTGVSELEQVKHDNADCFTRTAVPVSEIYREVSVLERKTPTGASRCFAEVKWQRSDWLKSLDGDGAFDSRDIRDFLEILYASCSGMNDTEYVLTMEVSPAVAQYSGKYADRNPVEQEFVRELGFERTMERSVRAVYLGHGFGGSEQVLQEKALEVAEIVGSLSPAEPESEQQPVADTVVLRSTDLGLGGFGQNNARREMLELLSRKYSIEENALKKVIDLIETIPVRRSPEHTAEYLQSNSAANLVKQIIFEWWSMGGATGAHSIALMVQIQRQFPQYRTIPMTAILYSPITHGSTESLASGYTGALLKLNELLGTTPGVRRFATRALREIPTRLIVRHKMSAKTPEQIRNADQLAGIISRYPRDSFRLVRELSKRGGYAGIPHPVAEIISEGRDAHVIVVIGGKDRIVDPRMTEESYRSLGDPVIQKKLDKLSFDIDGKPFGYEGAIDLVSMLNDFFEAQHADTTASFTEKFLNFIIANRALYKADLVDAIVVSLQSRMESGGLAITQHPEWIVQATSVVSEIDTIQQLHKRGPVIGYFPDMPHSTIFDQNEIERHILRVTSFTRPSDLRDILYFVENEQFWSAAMRLATSVIDIYRQNPDRIDPRAVESAQSILGADTRHGGRVSESHVRRNLEDAGRHYLEEVFGTMLYQFKLPS